MERRKSRQPFVHFSWGNNKIPSKSACDGAAGKPASGAPSTSSLAGQDAVLATCHSC